MKYQAVIFDYRGTLGFKGIPEFVPQMIRQLYNSGYLLGVISNNHRYGDTRWLRQKLVEHELFEYFQCIVGSAVLESGEMWVSGGIHKPDPRIFLRLLNLLGVEPHEAVYVGDSFRHDILGAGSVGMETLYVNLSDTSDIECPYGSVGNSVGNNSYAQELWDLLEDSPGIVRYNRITGFRLKAENVFECMLRDLTEPLVIGQSVVIGKREYLISSFSPQHTKHDIIHADSDTILTMNVHPTDEKELNNFTGIDLKD